MNSSAADGQRGITHENKPDRLLGLPMPIKVISVMLFRILKKTIWFVQYFLPVTLIFLYGIYFIDWQTKVSEHPWVVVKGSFVVVGGLITLPNSFRHMALSQTDADYDNIVLAYYADFIELTKPAVNWYRSIKKELDK